MAIDSTALCNAENRRGGENTSCVGSVADTFYPPPHGICPKERVSPDNALTERACWFVMRAAYGQERKAKVRLEGMGIEVFLPTVRKLHIVRGKRVIRDHSLIPNLLFVRTTELRLKELVGRDTFHYFHHYYVPAKDEKGNPVGKRGIRPLIVPESQMDQFRCWNEVNDDNKLFVEIDGCTLKDNEKVRVIGGRFKGISGFICRYKGQSRVGVRIEGLGTIFTAFVPKMYLEKVL